MHKTKAVELPPTTTRTRHAILYWDGFPVQATSRSLIPRSTLGFRDPDSGTLYRRDENVYVRRQTMHAAIKGACTLERYLLLFAQSIERTRQERIFRYSMLNSA